MEKECKPKNQPWRVENSFFDLEKGLATKGNRTVHNKESGRNRGSEHLSDDENRPDT